MNAQDDLKLCILRMREGKKSRFKRPKHNRTKISVGFLQTLYVISMQFKDSRYTSKGNNLI